ncbi:hypothetical protein [Mycobacterium sp. PS03-16]|uniref:hypothetical protein n=1 Tax=Mycobacterium sp. PS03-16 TaxID=2559611 RepID=UPI001FD7B997|nr:hypothetical protein [Mycobacterium sp. PS03-16]
MNEPLVVAETGRFVVAEDADRVLLFDRGHTPSEVAILLLIIGALVFGMFGLVTLLTALTGTPAPRSMAIGAAFLAVGVASFAGMMRAVSAHRRSRSTPLRERRPAAVFDRRYRVFVDAGGEIVAPLDQVTFTRRMRLASSAPELVAVTPAGTRVLLRGSPFTGGVGNLDAVLDAMVHGAR